MDAHPTIVVTGAAGFIGRACLAHLAARGFTVRGLVRALDAHTAGRAEFLPVGDLATTDARLLQHALRGAHAVVHLAARAHRMRDDAADPEAEYRRENVDVARRVLQAAAEAGVPHLVLASTVKVNGEATSRGHPFREDDPPHPHDAYAKSKWMAEQATAEIAEAAGVRATALRLPLTYGPGVHANLDALARAVRRGIPLPFGGVANRRSLLGLGNFCDALAVLLASDGRAERGRLTRYFVADAAPASTPEIVRAMADAMRVPARLVALPPPWLRLGAMCVGHANRAQRLMDSLEVDTSAFRTRFGWTPPLSLAQGMAAAFGNRAPL
ncbi:MAG: NAD-dependent epimerase/dehydratase family protein [Burkholderiales bacterium]